MQLQVSVQELVLLAQFCAGFERDARAPQLQALIRRVQMAAQFRQITGRAHPFYGDGSVASLLLRYRSRAFHGVMQTSALEAFGVSLRAVLEQSAETD